MRKYSRGVKDILETGAASQLPADGIAMEQDPEESSRMLGEWLRSSGLDPTNQEVAQDDKQSLRHGRDDFKKMREAFMPQMESHNNLDSLKMREFDRLKSGAEQHAFLRISHDKSAAIPEEQPDINSASSNQRSQPNEEEALAHMRASRIGEIAQAFSKEAQQELDRRVRLEEHAQMTENSHLVNQG